MRRKDRDLGAQAALEILVASTMRTKLTQIAIIWRKKTARIFPQIQTKSRTKI